MMRRAILSSPLFSLAACERAKTPASGAPAGAPPPPASSAETATVRRRTSWDDELGSLLATPSLDGGTPVLFVRDTAANADIEVELFNHDDHTARASLHPGTRDSRVRMAPERVAHHERWQTAFRTPGRSRLSPGIATPFGIDGVAELLPRDSAATVARISRLVSAIPEDSTSSPFRGLPIVVRDAWRFQLADSTAVAVAIATRSLNVESNPRAQAITLIAEPDPSRRGAVAHRVLRTLAGPEDRVEGMDLLAAFQLHGAQPAVALVREGDAGLAD